MTDQKEKVIFYFQEKISVHIDCSSGRFYNGSILEVNEIKNFLLLNDRVLGEIPILFEEIENIEKMRGEE